MEIKLFDMEVTPMNDTK